MRSIIFVFLLSIVFPSVIWAQNDWESVADNFFIAREKVGGNPATSLFRIEPTPSKDNPYNLQAISSRGTKENNDISLVEGGKFKKLTNKMTLTSQYPTPAQIKSGKARPLVIYDKRVNFLVKNFPEKTKITLLKKVKEYREKNDSRPPKYYKTVDVLITFPKGAKIEYIPHPGGNPTYASFKNVKTKISIGEQFKIQMNEMDIPHLIKHASLGPAISISQIDYAKKLDRFHNGTPYNFLNEGIGCK